MITMNLLREQRTMNAVIMQDPYVTLLHAGENIGNHDDSVSIEEFEAACDLLHRCRMQLLYEDRAQLHRQEMIERQEELRARSARRRSA